MTEQSTSRTKQYWNYTIPEKVKYATGEHFTTLRDVPHIDGLTETEIESCYAAGIQWIELTIPVHKNREGFEAYQMLNVVCAVSEYKSTVVDREMIKNRDIKMFGLRVNDLLRTTFGNLSSDLYKQVFEEFYWFIELTTLKTCGKSDALQGLWYKTMATNIDNYLTLRDVDGLFSLSFVVALCCNTDEKINELPEWHYECVDTAIWIYDAISAAKHRAEGEPCDLSRYIDDGMPESVTRMLEYARQKVWHLNKKYGKEARYQPHKALMQSVFAWTYAMYRYRHIEFLGPVLAKNTEEDDKATKNENYVWYKITQDGGPVGVTRKYRETIKTGNMDETKVALNRNYTLECKEVMKAVLSEDMKKYNEIDFPISKNKTVRI